MPRCQIMMYRAYLGLRALRYEPGRGKKLLATAPLSLKFVRHNLPSSFVVDTLIPPSPTEPTPSLQTTNLDSGVTFTSSPVKATGDHVKVQGCESSACLVIPSASDSAAVVALTSANKVE